MGALMHEAFILILLRIPLTSSRMKSYRNQKSVVLFKQIIPRNITIQLDQLVGLIGVLAFLLFQFAFNLHSNQAFAISPISSAKKHSRKAPDHLR
jgi:hypothetical protein